MNDSELISKIGKKLGCIIAWHKGDDNCKKCKGIGFVPIPLWMKLKAHFIERLPWKCIRKELFCTACKGYLVFEEPDGTVFDDRKLKDEDKV